MTPEPPIDDPEPSDPCPDCGGDPCGCDQLYDAYRDLQMEDV